MKLATLFQLSVILLSLPAFDCSLSASERKADESKKRESPGAESMRGKKAGQLRDDNSLNIKMIWCPPGKFTMGSPESEKGRFTDEDQVDVTLTFGFWLGRTETTQQQWESVMGTTPWKGKRSEMKGGEYPATYVSLDDAMAFCRKLTDRERELRQLSVDWEFNLPTEAQWEYACRGGTTTVYSFGNDELQLNEYAWWGGIFGDGNAKTERYNHLVGQKKPNPWGFHDMHGNVSEWCRDLKIHNLPGGRDPLVTSGSLRQVTRGAHWGQPAADLRSAHRSECVASNRYPSLGFRIALMPSRQVE